MIQSLPPEHYKIMILSDNIYLRLGLKYLAPLIAGYHQDIIQIPETRPNNLLHLRENILNNPPATRWIAFCENDRIGYFETLLPAEKVRVVPDNLSLSSLRRTLQEPQFAREQEQKSLLTRSELRVCSLLSQGFNIAWIARQLNKSPKTIYTHRRNAMSKFHCHSLVEFHRKICLLETRSLYN